MSDDVLLEEGAVLPAGTAVAKADTVDRLAARAYHHPVLDDQVVVRLVPATLGAAEDLTMEFLGFDQPHQVDEVGDVKRQTLGFPAWALVHDPANGHHALALVKEIERLARVAASRIGPAKEGFTELGERLARAVPHFLPTYYEQAGRVFLAVDSPSYAAMMFGKAREAERTFALDIDEERQHAVFLEFALAGALTAKALGAHARDLAARSDPATAYQRFRRLCVERTLGGLAPYAGMPADLRRLAKAAGLEQANADEEVIRQLLPAPALAGAPESFWTSYRGALARLGRADPHVVRQLLAFVPEHCGGETWLALLEEAGATTVLAAPAAATPDGGAGEGPAGWLSRFIEAKTGRQPVPALLELIPRLAPRLVADGAAVRACPNYHVDVEVVDACLAYGIPVAGPTGVVNFPLERYLGSGRVGRRDLAAVSADPRFLPALVAAVVAYLPDKPEPERLRRVLAVPGLRVAVRHRLDELAQAVASGGLPETGRHLRELRRFMVAETAGTDPAAIARIARSDLAAVLGRTLHSGVFDEYGWPALEGALDWLADGDARPQIHVTAQWPALVLRCGLRVSAVGADRELLRHQLRIPADAQRQLWRLALRYIDGQLLVSWATGSGRAGYWSGTPDDVLTGLPLDAFADDEGGSLALAGGGRTCGDRPFYVGDRVEHVGGRVITDGTTYWVWDGDGAARAFHEYDPATGVRGRSSLPAFFEDHRPDGVRLVLEWSSLRSAPAGSASPLGEAGGLVGWRAWSGLDGGRGGESVDGRRFELAATGDDSDALVGAIRFPGAGADFGMLVEETWRGSSTTTVRAGDGFALSRLLTGARRPAFAAGTPLVPGPAFWHHLRPRDPEGSAALRAITDEQVAALLTAATGQEPSTLPDLVRHAIPRLSHPDLIAGVAGIVGVAAARAADLAELVAIVAGIADPTAATSTEVVGEAGGLRDGELMRAMDGLIVHCYDRGGSAEQMIRVAGAALTSAEPPVAVTPLTGDFDWFDVLGVIPAVIYRAASPVTPADQRAVLAELLGLCAGSGLLAPGSRCRRVDLTGTAPGPIPQAGSVLRVGTRRLLVLRSNHGGRETTPELTVLEYAAGGDLGPVPGYVLDGERHYTDGDSDPAWIAAFAEQITGDGPAPWRPELVDAVSDAAGISRAEAFVLLLGFADERVEDVAGTEGNAADGDARDVRPLEPALPATWLKVARSTWSSAGRERRAELVAALLPQEPQRLWRDGPDVAKLAAVVGARGTRRPVPDELIVEVDRARVAGRVGASEILHGLANPDSCAWLATADAGVDAAALLPSVVATVSWLVYHLPGDDPIRDRLPVAVSRLTQLVASADFRMRAGWLDEEQIPRFAEALGAEVITGADGVAIGPFWFPPDTGWRRVDIRPGLLAGTGEAELATFTAFGSLYGEPFTALGMVLRGDLARMVTASTTPLDGSLQDPSRSTPELVAEVAAALGLSADAATLYLQLLALPDPTDRNVARWTGWKPARLKAARAELAATPLVVTAKRARAGRSLFLPGGWLALKAPYLPVEAWKAPLLTLDGDGRAHIGIIVPSAGVVAAFHQAWSRVQGGDTPRFDELVTERRR